jgi:hypothetical protein
VIDAEGIVALEQAGVAALVPPEETGTGPPGTPCRVLDHREGFIGGQTSASQAHHADARGDVVIQHDNSILGEAAQGPVSHRADAGDFVRNGLDDEPGVAVVFSLAFRNE